MRRVVIDASVVIKWLLPDRDDERDARKALKLLYEIRSNQIIVIQPAHWLAEVAAVVSRLSPETAEDDILDLCSLHFEELQTRDVLLRASEISIQLNHHFFDTLYHAVALSCADTILLTADERYWSKSTHLGSIALLRDSS